MGEFSKTGVGISDNNNLPAFFRHHGFFAPGIRAFRSIGFPAKAAWVSAAFLMPIVILTWALWEAASVNIDFSQKERLGTEYVRTILPLLDAAQNRRRAALANAQDLGDMQERVSKALRTTADVQARLGGALNTESSWKKIEQLQKGLEAKANPDPIAATFASHTEFINAVFSLLDDVADNSNLTLDPDVDTYYLMDAAVSKQPLLVESMGQLRGMGNGAILAGSINLSQREIIGNALAFAKAYDAGTRKAIGRASGSDPAISATVRLNEAVTASATFLNIVREQVLDDVAKGDAKSFVEAGNLAIKLHYDAMYRELDELDARISKRIEKLKRSLWGQLAIAGCGIAVAIYMLISFYRVTQGGIAEVSRHLTEISRGNLALTPQPWGRDEVSRLMNTLAATVASLRSVVGNVRASAGEIQTASDEVASASEDLSQRTEEAASNLQRTTAVMSQIEEKVRQTAQTANGAAGLVDRNAKVAEQGGGVVAQVVNTMSDIRDSSGHISDIIGTIDGIAFQTNILALNAAVEAARAGEQGRGFAVVASEVRALAQRASAAAKEISTLISASVEQVENGAKVVELAGSTMEQIVGNASDVKMLMEEISAATNDQTSGLAMAKSEVGQIDEMTQQNAALVEQTAAAAALLKANAEKLTQEMAFFSLL
ncbi:methyl-accepting chemotaxis protein [Herbaspirillum huttiense]|uniref:methyl-accepting chemotaxis protein n=3 Tax=Pseudomonadota TaxID=1224 RepID=UPI002E77C210|nr:methyl-accepting chemotaxis protein [Herbaspirillum huttiense]MEE1635618.1 methyl-accepting chemotaxis protein [Herbaspirillum huttiense NC40101]